MKYTILIFSSFLWVATSDAKIQSQTRAHSRNSPETSEDHPITPIESKSCSAKTAQRELWAEHVIYTRDYIEAALTDAPNKDLVAKRLMLNQENIGNSIRPFFGSKAGTKLSKLLKEHISIAAEVVDAAKKDDKEKLTDANTRWHENADEIAEFLAEENPYWVEESWKKMLYEHLKLTTEETVARLKKQWQKDIDTFDKIFKQAMEMADSLTYGLIKQFPNKF
jgi:hypothetical protein